MLWDEKKAMTQIKHHLTDELLMAYSAGNLPEAFSLVVATHLSLCDACRAQAETFDALGGALVEGTASATLSPGALETTLARIAATDGAEGYRTPNEPDTNSVFPKPLRDYVGGDLERVKWHRIGGGVRQAILPCAKGASARLLFIPAGTGVPDHGHRGTELTMVLQGAFRDEVDRFGRGDVEVANEDLQHTPVAEAGEDCICLAATDAPLKFTGFLPRIAQPFLRI